MRVRAEAREQERRERCCGLPPAGGATVTVRKRGRQFGPLVQNHNKVTDIV